MQELPFLLAYMTDVHSSFSLKNVGNVLPVSFTVSSGLCGAHEVDVTRPFVLVSMQSVYVLEEGANFISIICML
jgi:hypothetical protein